MSRLTNCSQCSGQISLLAKLICPHCGCPADIALKEKKLTEDPPKAQVQTGGITEKEVKSYCVSTSGDTRPHKDKMKKSFGLRWKRSKNQWEGVLESDEKLMRFIEYCEDNGIEHTAPRTAGNMSGTVQGNALPPENVSKIKQQLEREKILGSSNLTEEHQSELDRVREIPDSQIRKAEEGIGGSREDWKKNRKGYSGDMA